MPLSAQIVDGRKTFIPLGTSVPMKEMQTVREVKVEVGASHHSLMTLE